MAYRTSYYFAASAHDFSVLDLSPYQQTATSRTFTDGANDAGYLTRYEDTVTVRCAGGELVLAGKGFVVDSAGHLVGGRLQGILVDRVDPVTGVHTRDWSIEQVDMGARDIDAALRSVTTVDDQAFLNVMLDRGSDIMRLSAGNDVAVGRDGHDHLSGGGGNDRLEGGLGDDRLQGGPGLDTLVGGSGADQFIFSDYPSTAADLDTITDFVRGVDRIGLDGDLFNIGLPGALEPGVFRLGTAAADADDRVLYEVSTGLLRYDDDGNGTAYAPTPFARVSAGTPLSAADLFVWTSRPAQTFRPSYYFAETAHDFSTLDFRPYQETATSRTFVDGANYAGYGVRYDDTLTVRFGGGELVFAGKDLSIDLAGHLSGGRLQAIIVNHVDASTGARSLDWSIEQVDMGARDADAALRSATTADDQSFLQVMLDRGRDTVSLSTGDDVADGRNGDDYLFGDSGNDWLEGGIGRDTLQGGLGRDTLSGGPGDDIYVAYTSDDRTDVRIEFAGGGIDWIYSDYSWTLAADFENLLLSSADDASDGTGNAAANALYGNRNANRLTGLDGEDTLVGERGNDTLTGGAGGDEFRFRSAPVQGLTDVDTLADFTSGLDRIALEDSAFSALGPAGRLPTAFFRTGTAAQDADDRIIYDAASGSVWYDGDGNGSGSSAILFAKLAPGSALTASDFIVV